MARSVDDRTSRYVHGGNTTTFDNRLGWWERRDIPQDEEDQKVIINQEYHRRPDKMAFDIYGRASYMWFILQYNNILDDKTEFIEGKEIRLPNISRVTLDIFNKQTGGNQ